MDIRDVRGNGGVLGCRGGGVLVKLLVCGGRDYQDRSAVYDEMTRLEPSFVIHGGCPTGADLFAEEWIFRNYVPRRIYMAQWSKHGKAAGPIRNQQMIDEGKPDMVLAFPGGKGTADMVRRAKAAGIVVIEWGI